MAALFGASEEGNLQGIKDLVNMAQNIDLFATNKVFIFGSKIKSVIFSHIILNRFKIVHV